MTWEGVGLAGLVLAFVGGYFTSREGAGRWSVPVLLAGLAIWLGGFCLAPDPCRGLDGMNLAQCDESYPRERRW